MINIEALQVRLVKSLGELNSKRIASIVKNVSPFYKNFEEEKNSVFFFDPTGEEQEVGIEVKNGLFVTEKGLTFLLTTEQQENGTAFDIINKITSSVYETLLLEPNEIELVVEMIAKSESAVPTIEGSRILMTEKVSFEDVQGVGLRLLLDNDNFTGEFKFEPFIEDDKYYYSDMKVRFKDTKTLEEIISSVEDLEKDLRARISLLILN